VKKLFYEKQLVKCTQDTWPQCFWVFNEARSYFPELCPKNIFFNDNDLVFFAFAENKLIFKENYVLQWGIPQDHLQLKLRLLALIHSQHFGDCVIPMDMCDNANTLTFRKNFEHYIIKMEKGLMLRPK